MRILFLCLLLIPLCAAAQINRSATEFAQERIRDYLVNKVGIAAPAKLCSYGELKPESSRKGKIAWTMSYKLLVSTDQPVKNRDEVISMSSMIFYFDKRMKILSAESYSPI